MAARSTFLALAASAVLLSGCGASDDPAAPAPLPLGPATAVEPLTGAKAVEKTDGRLGGATTVGPSGELHELSAGGRLDVRPGAHDQRRDGVGAGASCPDATLAAAPEALAAMAASQLCRLNGERADAGLAPLTLNDKLSSAATAYAADLVGNSYFSHTGRDGSTIRTRLEAVSYLPQDGGWAIGENLAWGTGALATPGSIMQAWMNSPGHRSNILNPEYREIGIGVVVGNPSVADGSGATYANAFGVIDDAGDSAADGDGDGADAAPAEPVAQPPRAHKQHKGRKARRRAAKHRKARIARREAHAKGKGKRKSRGPRARIAI